MIISLDLDSATPPYAQIQDQVATMIRSGVLQAGARLPTIRHLATDLAVASGTVARAYRELEAEGLVVARGRHGTLVLPAVPANSGVAAVDREVADVASSFALAASHRGLGLDQALDAVRVAFARLSDGGSTT